MTATQLSARIEGQPPSRETQPIALVDLLDRLIGVGVVLSGDVLISMAGVDLVEIRLRALIRTVHQQEQT